MPSVSRVVMTIGFALLVLGSIFAVIGTAQQFSQSCESGYSVTVERLGASETPVSADEEVRYSNLSTSEQQLFDEIRTTDDPPVYDEMSVVDGLAGDVVVYRGDRYEISSPRAADCPSSWMFFQYLGGLAALLGAFLVGGTRGVRRLRE